MTENLKAKFNDLVSFSGVRENIFWLQLSPSNPFFWIFMSFRFMELPTRSTLFFEDLKTQTKSKIMSHQGRIITFWCVIHVSRALDPYNMLTTITKYDYLQTLNSYVQTRTEMFPLNPLVQIDETAFYKTLELYSLMNGLVFKFLDWEIWSKNVACYISWFNYDSHFSVAICKTWSFWYFSQ